MKRTLLVAALAMLVSACSKYDTREFSDRSIGDITGGIFMTDTGLRYNVTEQTCEGRLDTMKRAMVTCDVLRRVSASEYDIRLRRIERVLLKEPLTEEAADSVAVGDDPVFISSSWFSGGYINLSVTIPFLQDSGTTHIINLVREEGPASDTLSFSLRHNANGEVLSGNNEDGLVLGYALVSFPVSELIPEGKASVPVKISYRWYSTDAESYSEENTRIISETGTFWK